MAEESSTLSALSNPLVTADQLTTTSSQLDGIPSDLEASLRFTGAQLTQAAGNLLHLPQELIVQAIVLFYRFYVGSEGGSFLINSVHDVSAACIYLVAKPSFHPKAPRSVLNVYAYLKSSVSPLRSSLDHASSEKPDPHSYYVSEGEYISRRSTLLQTESIILRAIAFTTQVKAPHTLALTYLQTLSVLPNPPTGKSTALARRTLEYLNTELFSPQLLYLTHQPNGLAIAAIYLAAREVGQKLTEGEWWEVFDVDREELGFLVVGLGSVEGWVKKEMKERERDGAFMVTVMDVEKELGRRRAAEEADGEG